MAEIKLGVVTQIERNKDIPAQFAVISEMGFETCQLHCWDESLLKPDIAEAAARAAGEAGIKITAFWCGWQGPAAWDFYDGPLTLGLIPEAYRARRLETLMRGADFAQRAGIDRLATHVGFVPESPRAPEYPGLVAALAHLADHCAARGQRFLFETGQETPVTLCRVIADVGRDNLGVNLDPANLLMYGKANPVDAVEVLGPYIVEVHAKDGLYPSDGRSLGPEVPLGQGMVDFPRLIGKLIENGYSGSLTIEREIYGAQQNEDILKGKALLEEILTEGCQHV